MKPSYKAMRTWAGLAVGCLLIVLMLRWFEHSQVFHPSRAMDAQADALGVPFEDVTLKSDGLALNAWFFSAPTNSPRPKMAVIVCHGNGGNISHRLDVCQALLDAGLNVLIFDYRGYGRSEGRVSEAGTYQDAQAAYRWLEARGFAPANILAYGESLGGGVACELASRESCGGLILQSTFTCIPDIGAELFPWLPVRWLSRIKYDTCKKLPSLRIPVLVMHSRQDDLIPFRHAERNYAVASEPKLFRELSGSHNDPLADLDKFNSAIDDFLKLVEAQPGASARERVEVPGT